MTGKSSLELANELIELKNRPAINVPITPFVIWFIICQLQLVMDAQFIKDREILVKRVREVADYLQSFVDWPEAVRDALNRGWKD